MEKVSIELPVHAWLAIMQRLAKFPFEEVADLIAEIKRQGDAILATSNESPPDPDEK